MIGEGNGTPLQNSCLENPMDGGAWWAAVCGVTQSQTQLHFHFHFSLSCIGEGNGNPLQYSCLENPRDGGAWWAAVCGVAQGWTRLSDLAAAAAAANECGQPLEEQSVANSQQGSEDLNPIISRNRILPTI